MKFFYTIIDKWIAKKVDKVINIGTNTENDYELGSVKVAEPLEDPE